MNGRNLALDPGDNGIRMSEYSRCIQCVPLVQNRKDLNLNLLFLIMGALCGPGGGSPGCCGAGAAYGPPPEFPVGYGLVCCGMPAGCCGYGEGLGPGGPCSCGGDCCGISGNLFSNSDCCDYCCCGCCGMTRNRCCGCGTGAGATACGGMGYCGGGCCCCCPADYQSNRSSRRLVQPAPVAPQISPLMTAPTPQPLVPMPPPILRPITPQPVTTMVIAPPRPSTPVTRPNPQPALIHPITSIPNAPQIPIRPPVSNVVPTTRIVPSRPSGLANQYPNLNSQMYPYQCSAENLNNISMPGSPSLPRPF